ncbi:unnamed protein product, partial [Didymodactylos carnosus]
TRIASRPRKKKDDFEHESETMMNSCRNLNDFLGAFIDHSLTNLDYNVRERLLMEKIVNFEFRPYADTVFYTDPDRNFTRTLFYAQEQALFIWNMATFCVVDYIATNYVLAAIVTYILNKIAVMLRNSFGRRNLSRKTLIPNNFLI